MYLLKTPLARAGHLGAAESACAMASARPRRRTDAPASATPELPLPLQLLCHPGFI